MSDYIDPQVPLEQCIDEITEILSKRSTDINDRPPFRSDIFSRDHPNFQNSAGDPYHQQKVLSDAEDPYHQQKVLSDLFLAILLDFAQMEESVDINEMVRKRLEKHRNEGTIELAIVLEREVFTNDE